MVTQQLKDSTFRWNCCLEKVKHILPNGAGLMVNYPMVESKTSPEKQTQVIAK